MGIPFYIIFTNTMNFTQFTSLVHNNPAGVVLLEGRRSIPADYGQQAHALAASLASRFPTLRFRSGNALGSDDAFSRGVAGVDASRLQVIAPYASHRKGDRYINAIYDSPESLSALKAEQIASLTSAASPMNKGWLPSATRRGPWQLKRPT